MPNDKALELLELIVCKRVNMVNIYDTDNVVEYNRALCTEIALTRKEYNRIKELCLWK